MVCSGSGRDERTVRTEWKALGLPAAMRSKAIAMKMHSRLASACCPPFIAEDGSVAAALSTLCVDSALKTDYGRCYLSTLASRYSITGLSVALGKHLRPR